MRPALVVGLVIAALLSACGQPAVRRQPAPGPRVARGAERPAALAAGPNPAVVSSVRTDAPWVALTFDDGPNGATGDILRELRAAGAAATFFLTCDEVERRPEMVRAIVDSGSEVANHTYSHPRLAGRPAGFIAREVERCGRLLSRLAGRPVRLFRFPYMRATPPEVAEVRRLGYTVIGASVDPQDWRRPGPAAIAGHVAAEARPGDIVLLHDRSQTAAALPRLLAALRARGLRSVTVSQLLASARSGGSPEVGRR